VLGAPRTTIRELTQRANIDRVMLPPARIGMGHRDIQRICDLSPHPVTVAT
jgi:hypothetical protein